MKNFRHLFLLLLAASLLSTGAFAQGEEPESERNNVPPRLQEQQDMYERGEYLFPAQKRSNWSVGIGGGLSFVSGDVNAQPGWGALLNVRKALGHIFSVRAQFATGSTKGLDYRRSNGFKTGRGGGSPWALHYYNTQTGAEDLVFYNYQMNYYDASIQGVVNLNNINFYKEQNKWNLYAAAGFGGVAYHTRVDALDANGAKYDFSGIKSIGEYESVFSFPGARREVWDELKNLLDGEYESVAEQYQSSKPSLKLGEDDNGNAKYYTINPTLIASAGLRFRISRRVDLGIEHRINWTNDDLLDGVRWGLGGAETGDFDAYHLTSVNLTFRLGPGEESLWWENPLQEVYKTSADAKSKLAKLEQDTDEDGVPDIFDKEPETPDGYSVDPSGRTMDSDGDGYPDNVDDEPFSPKGSQVDARGKALDADDDGVPDVFDIEPNTKAGALVDAKGREIGCLCETPEPPKQVEGGLPCAFPSIHFDLDKDAIKPEFYPELYYIARVVKTGGKSVRIIGFTDNRNTDAYNMNLSERRANSVKDFLMKNFGIAAGKISIEFKGETNPVIGDLPDNHSNPKFESLHYVNRRVEVECID